MLPIFLKILWVDKNGNMVLLEYPNDTYLSFKSGNISNYGGSEKIYLDIFIYINGSKVYPG